MKSNVNQAVQSYISWKSNGGYIETDRINTEEVAQKLAAIQKQAEVMQVIEKEAQLVSTGEKVGVVLGQLTNGFIKAAGVFAKEVGKGLNTYVQTTKGITTEDYRTKAAHIVTNKLDGEVKIGNKTAVFVKGDLTAWK